MTHDGRNGLYVYGQAQDESPGERERSERFWRSLGKQVRQGPAIRIPAGYDTRRRGR